MNIDTYYCNSTKLLRQLRKYNYADGGTHGVYVSARSGTKIATKFRISQNLSNFDCDVADAIYTIYANGHGSFTPGQVLRVLSGDDKQTIVRGFNKQRIIDSIELLRKTEIEIGCRDIMQARNISVDRFKKAPFLSVEKISANPRYSMPLRRDYEEMTMQEMYADFFMPLYGYAKLLRQINAFPQRLLHGEAPTPESRMSNTLENIQIKRYLIRRLEPLRNGHQRIEDQEDGLHLIPQNPTEYACRHRHYMPIVYVWDDGIGGMLADLGIFREDYESTDSWKHKRHSVHHTVVKILDYYRHIGYIKEYRVDKKGRLIHGVTILGKVSYPLPK